LASEGFPFCGQGFSKKPENRIREGSAPTAAQATAELDAFEELEGSGNDPGDRIPRQRAGKYASIAPAWRRAWAEVIALFAFDPAIRNFEKGGRNAREWFAARNQLAIVFEERFDA
jgi:hypothetical protein